jgi:hypothetical protein
MLADYYILIYICCHKVINSVGSKRQLVTALDDEGDGLILCE